MSQRVCLLLLSLMLVASFLDSGVDGHWFGARAVDGDDDDGDDDDDDGDDENDSVGSVAQSYENEMKKHDGFMKPGDKKNIRMLRNVYMEIIPKIDVAKCQIKACDSATAIPLFRKVHDFCVAEEQNEMEGVFFMVNLIKLATCFKGEWELEHPPVTVNFDNLTEIERQMWKAVEDDADEREKGVSPLTLDEDKLMNNMRVFFAEDASFYAENEIDIEEREEKKRKAMKIVRKEKRVNQKSEVINLDERIRKLKALLLKLEK